ncbi:MAG: hypothetical protein BGO01_04170 [Armatimonadetes bacterium 55-13]|nr:hypothetical protein [Armatimonadota bacterium]OJU63345.1 MAG: hypothetical protein BGO01_04170 [Armatimonadetes bacterium 55-13]
MLNTKFSASVLAAIAIGGFVVLPTASLAVMPDDHRGHGRDQGNRGKNPKDHGRHDNRDQHWKDNDRRREEDRRREDERRREEARRREDARRREEQRRRDEARRREDERRREEARRRSSYDSLRRESDRRQQTKNEWRNIAIASGAVTVLGLLKKDNTLTFAGAAGTLYSLYRYEQDRKSQSSLDRARATYFSKPYFYRDGHKYTRYTVTKNGKKYYQFRR